MLLAISFEATISLGAALVALVLALGTIAAILGGGRRWRENYEAEAAAHKHTAEELAARDATLLEKDHLVEGQQSRLKRLDETLQEMGGKRVVDQLLQFQKESLERYGAGMSELASLFARIGERIDSSTTAQLAALDAHEERAAARAERVEAAMVEREEKLISLLDAVLVKVNGGGR